MARTSAVVLFFVFTSVLFTWPLVLNLSTSLDNAADSPVETCLLAWMGRNLWTQPTNLFAAPLFYPHPNPLKVGFHIWLVAFISFPIRVLCGHPVTTLNILFILTLAMDGVAMFYLARYLTRNASAAVIAGLIFAFCPFRFSNFQYTAFMANYWIVFAFLSLLKCRDRAEGIRGRSLRYFPLSLLFFLFQCASDLITGIYFSILYFPLMLHILFVQRHSLNGRTVARMLSLIVLLGLALAVLVSPQRSLRRALGREGMQWDVEGIQELSSTLSCYLATPPGNILYGKITRGFYANTRHISFFGATAYLLALFGAVRVRNRGERVPPKPGLWRKGLALVRSLQLSPRNEVRFCLLIFLVSLVLSLGPFVYLTPGRRICPSPYLLLYHLMPAIRTIRTLGGMGMTALLCLSVLAAFGAKNILDYCAARSLARPAVVRVALALLLGIEYASYPPTSWGVPFFFVPKHPPAVYQWLMSQSDKDPLIELPMAWEPEEVGGSFGLDANGMYWSLFHGRRIVNGLSTFFYPEYKIIVDQMKLFPSRETIDILRSLGARYVIIHIGRLPKLEWQKEIIRNNPEAAYDWRETLDRLDEFAGELALRVKAGGDRLYEVLPPRGHHPPAPAGPPIPRRGWMAAANTNPAAAPLAIDGRVETAWATEQNQRAGLFFQLDLGRPEEIGGVRMLLRSASECPKNPRVEVSDDGAEWTAVEYEGAYLEFVRRLLANPGERWFGIVFPPVRARFVRITLTRLDNLYPWSIAELEVLGGAATRAGGG